jgi:hypothetical protein
MKYYDGRLKPFHEKPDRAYGIEPQRFRKIFIVLIGEDLKTVRKWTLSVHI